MNVSNTMLEPSNAARTMPPPFPSLPGQNISPRVASIAMLPGYGHADIQQLSMQCGPPWECEPSRSTRTTPVPLPKYSFPALTGGAAASKPVNATMQDALDVGMWPPKRIGGC